jgi:hypothetical protein
VGNVGRLNLLFNIPQLADGVLNDISDEVFFDIILNLGGMGNSGCYLQDLSRSFDGVGPCALELVRRISLKEGEKRRGENNEKEW